MRKSSLQKEKEIWNVLLSQRCNYRQKGELYYKTRNGLGTCVGPNRSLNLTRTRAEFFVRSEYSKGSMLNVKQVLGHNTKIVTQTAVQNGARRLAPNR